MNISASECSSGCESGWTLYLDQSFVSETQFQRNGETVGYGEKGAREVEVEEEDLSMVSDASSGPPHYHEDDQDCFYRNGCSFSASWASESSKKENKKNKKKMKETCKNERYLYNLDDTASSPVSKARSHNRKIQNFPRNKALMEDVTGYSQSLSATHFKGESALENHYSLLQSSMAKNPATKEPGDLQGGNWE
ncbi:hypothetical protein FNV43_RR11718 [Rhamnella rubrinervis]|uniref:Uncharacterized protein n=1 Tax=Rhamnella rubrinervis TaxID=2594499 RepID=A0A8K0H6J4_9ROSA|nr:hypothetical protein FNV43_RR11718 [Rhamnella rubrinervis]